MKTRNQINPNKLLNSKWTAVKSIKMQKHFIVSEVEYDEDNKVIKCELEAVLTKCRTNIDWRSLQDRSQWLHGWK